MFQGKQIYLSNGKGTTKEYALASGYAEMYERFCNKILFYYNFPFSQLVANISKNTKGYYFHPNEKVMSFSEGMLQSQKIYNILTKSNTLDLLSLNLNNQWFGIPFYDINNKNNCKYLDPRIISMLESSTGMCAGNTKEEAIIQGLSEQFEHQIKWELINIIKEKNLYQLNLDNIKNKTLQIIIQNIQKENDLYLFDASYYYSTPVLFGLLINRNKKTVTINISSFPVFDIAVERICTELYQGVNSYEEDKIKSIFPSRDKEQIKEDYFWEESAGSFFRMSSLPEEILIKEKILCETPNYNVFLKNKEYSETEIYNYCLFICKNNHYNIYYNDCSLSSKIYAFKIYVEEIVNIPAFYLQKIPEKTKKGLILSHLLFHNFIFNGKIDLNIRNELFLTYSNFNQIEKSFFDRYRGRSFIYQIFNIYTPFDFNTICDLYLNKNFYLDENFNSKMNFYLFKDTYQEYVTKLRYLNSKYYSSNEIKNILNYLGIEIKKEDYEYYNDNNYIIDKIIFDNIYKLYNSQELLDYINLLISLEYANV